MTQEEQKVQELLKPRYIVENEWFDCPYPNGTILVQQTHSNGFGPEMWIPGQYTFLQDDLDKYPYLVRKLSWWEYRDASEMPEYVKYAEDGTVRKVNCFDLNTTSAWFMYLEGDGAPYCPSGSALENTHWLPATSAEYTAYISSPEPK